METTMGTQEEKVITLPDDESESQVYHEPREGIWQPSDKELRFDDEAGAGDETERTERVVKKPKKMDKELKKKKLHRDSDASEVRESKKSEKDEKGQLPLKKIKCKCGGEIIVKSSKRPIKIKCPECGRTGTLRK